MENSVYRQLGIIAFGDTDASGWMHFPNIFKYAEAAEHAFLHSRGILVFDREEGGWPRVKVTCDYKCPFRYGDSYEVALAISRIGASSVTWDFQVINAAGEVAALGSMTNVRVDHQGRPKLISDEERRELTHAAHLAQSLTPPE